MSAMRKVIILSAEALKLQSLSVQQAFAITRRQSLEKVTMLTRFGAIPADNPYICGKLANLKP